MCLLKCVHWKFQPWKSIWAQDLCSSPLEIQNSKIGGYPLSPHAVLVLLRNASFTNGKMMFTREPLRVYSMFLVFTQNSWNQLIWGKICKCVCVCVCSGRFMWVFNLPVIILSWDPSGTRLCWLCGNGCFSRWECAYVQLRHWQYHRHTLAGGYLPQGSVVKAKTGFLSCTNVDCLPDSHLRQGMKWTEINKIHSM